MARARARAKVNSRRRRRSFHERALAGEVLMVVAVMARCGAARALAAHCVALVGCLVQLLEVVVVRPRLVQDGRRRLRRHRRLRAQE